MRSPVPWICLMLVACLGNGDEDSLYGCSATDLAVELFSPNGGESFTGGDDVEIAWATDNLSENVDIDLLRDGAPTLAIARGVPNSGSFVWTVPIDLPAADDYAIRIAGGEYADDSDGPFAIANWQYRRIITVNAPETLDDHVVLVELGASDPAFDAAAGDGSDVRFASSATRDEGFDLPFYLERWDPGAGARIWVRLPAIEAGDATSFAMFYGAPGVDAASDIEAVFPQRLETSGDTTLSGTQSYDLISIAAADTVTVGAGQPLVLDAYLIDVAGTLEGSGAGFSGGVGPSDGAGPGGGGPSTEGGAGGGGYGGDGGNGGLDPGDDNGGGGPSNGAADGIIIDMGSGGGGTDLADGGNGGGAVTIDARTVRIGGSVVVDGADGDALSGDQSRGGGGGAGGGILLTGHDVDLAGALSAVGGAGGPGTIDAHDGGGGGGGGRIKIIHGGALTETGTVVVDGGIGGPGGDADDGDPGSAGTVRRTQVAPIDPTTAVGPQTALY